MSLPLYRTTARDARERKMLADWLAERDLDQRLRAAQNEETPARVAGLRYGPVESSPARLRAGDIALVHPAPGDVWGPLYLLVAELHGDTSCSGIPFGRYATPAVPGEWRTSFSSIQLRVLCFWNERRFALHHLFSQAVRRCSAGEYERIMRLRGRGETSIVLSTQEAKRFGPPLVHPVDPRYNYLQEERWRLEVHIGQGGSVNSIAADEQMISYDFRHREKSSWLLAAEGRARYGKMDRPTPDKS